MCGFTLNCTNVGNYVIAKIPNKFADIIQKSFLSLSLSLDNLHLPENNNNFHTNTWCKYNMSLCSIYHNQATKFILYYAFMAIFGHFISNNNTIPNAKIFARYIRSVRFKVVFFCSTITTCCYRQRFLCVPYILGIIHISVERWMEKVMVGVE